MRSIYLFRHGLPEFPGGVKRCLGLTPDLPLSAAGRAAAAAGADFFRQKQFQTVYSSPALRCRETAAALGGGLPVTVVDELHELCYGVWEGLTFDEIRSRYPALYERRGREPLCMPPGGETVEAGAARALSALCALLAASEGDVAVVAHSGLNRALLWRLSAAPPEEFRRFQQDYTHGNLLRYDGRQFTVHAVNQDISKLT